MKRLIAILLIVLPMSLRASDLNVLQILQVSNFDEISDNSIPGSDVGQVDFKPVYIIGYYFLDTRFQNIGEDKWMFRGLFKMKGIFLDNRYVPDIRYGYVENKKPVGGHWFFSAGRITTFNFLPVQRLDGLNIGFTPNEDGGWLFGLIGGMVPIETSGYRNMYLFNAPYRAGLYAQYSNKNADHIKIQYNAGMNDGTFIDGSGLFHQGLMEFTKRFTIVKYDDFIRGGVLYTYPYNTFDYAFAENSFHISDKSIHTIGYLKGETLFLNNNSYIKEDFQQAFYRLAFTSKDEHWHLIGLGGYTYSMGSDGYIAQIQLMAQKLFIKGNGQAGVDLMVQKKGVYEQYFGKLSFGFFPLWYLNFNLYVGPEYMKFRSVGTFGLVYGLMVHGEVAGGFSYDINADVRTIFNGTTEGYAGFNLMHYFNIHFEEKAKKQS